MKFSTSLPWLCPVLLAAVLPAHGQDIRLKAVEIPNDESFWRRSGFVEMVPPVRLPSDTSNDNLIKVWLRIPDGGKITLDWLADQKRHALRFPAGTIADRVETMRNQRKALQTINGIEDVRGGTIDADGGTLFHVYQPVAGRSPDLLSGFEWRRIDNASDDRAADSLIALFYPNASAEAKTESEFFRRLNQCGACHQPNQPAPWMAGARVPGRSNLLTDTHGFFQPSTVLESTMAVRAHRPWDLNVDDPFVTVSCGSTRVTATTDGNRRFYRCPNGEQPIGTLDVVAALAKGDAHARQVCEARKYLFDHMDEKAREPYAPFFAECSIASATAQAPAGGATPPPPLIRENATVKLADHVWAIPDFNVGLVPNVGIIVGSTATLVVDTGLGPRNGEAIVREMKTVSGNADVYVVTTHYHPEHSLGAGAFTGAKLVMTKMQQQDMTELGKGIQDTFASRSVLNKELLSGVPYPTPDILFDREHRLDLGGVHVRLFWRGPSAMHTRGDTMVFVEEDRVLFTGDVVMSQRFLAAQNNSSLKTWLSVLDELTALKPLHVVPSHGQLGDAALIARDRAFIQAVQARVGALKREGKSIDDAVAAVIAEIAPQYPESLEMRPTPVRWPARHTPKRNKVSDAL
ncbi:MAG: MBL fold metallo-hydrolase [Cyanobacteria bacterium]|nr:MBL fold metallo-hydrolase [Cyanobacteriota bacterium]